MRALWTVLLVAAVLVGETGASAAPSSAAPPPPPPPPPLAARSPSPASPVLRAGVHLLKPPDLFDVPYGRWDFFAVGGGGGYLFNVQFHLLTYHWRHVRVTAFESMFSFNQLEGSFDIHLGPTIGFGGHHGSRKAFSHWFLLGTWYGQMHPIIIFRVQTIYRGLFLMAGYEFRVHFGRRLNWLFGLRLFATGSPLGRNTTRPCTCDDGFMCSCVPDPDDPIRIPVTFGLTAFFGY